MSTEKLFKYEETPEPTIPPSHGSQNFVTISIPPQPENAGTLTNSVNCQVCRTFINLDKKHNNLVVKCDSCNEATPIKAAPPGKKYVRCTCNGLLICKSSSARVGCPRPHCKAIIALTPSTDEIGVVTGITNQTGLLAQSMRVVCVNCSSPFVISVQKQKRYMLGTCPHCQKNSSIGPYYARVKWGIFFTLSLICLAVGIGMTVGTYTLAREHGGYYVAYVGLLLCGVILMIRGCFYFFMPISTIESPLPQRM